MGQLYVNLVAHTDSFGMAVYVRGLFPLGRLGDGPSRIGSPSKIRIVIGAYPIYRNDKESRA